MSKTVNHFDEIPQSIKDKCSRYAVDSYNHKKQRVGYTNGTREESIRRMYVGKIGEEIVRLLFEETNIPFTPDDTPVESTDYFDFIVKEEKIDVKTTEAVGYHISEIVSMDKARPKDIYISVIVDKEKRQVSICGWLTRDQLCRVENIQMVGKRENYRVWQKDTNKIETLIERYKRTDHE